MRYTLNVRVTSDTPSHLLDEVNEISDGLATYAVQFVIKSLSFKADWIYSYIRISIKDDYNILGASGTLLSVHQVLGDRMYQLNLDGPE